MTKGEIAKNNFMQGYNCAQAVLLAFCDDLGFDEQTALMLASPFGGGIGRMREVCGTVTGMYMALGLARGYSDSKDNADKKRVYTEVQQLAERFKEEVFRTPSTPATRQDIPLITSSTFTPA